MAVVVALISLVATLIGGLAAARIRDRLHLVLGLAAGVMLGVVAFDLIPEALGSAGQPVFGVPAALLLAIAGFLTVHIVERSTAMHPAQEDRYEQHEHPGALAGTLAGSALVVHSLLDGIGIGIGFQAGSTVGATVAIAVIAHDFADGFNTFTLTSLHGGRRARAFVLLGLDAAAPVVGAVIGMSISLPTTATGLYLGYFAGLLLYLATADILPEAHANHPSRATLVFTTLGVAFVWLIVGYSR